MEIALQEITENNYEEAGELYLPEDQQDHLSHNMWSIAETMFNKSTHEMRAIYKQDNMVGFVMWVRLSEKLTSIWRFMIAHEHQQQGLGRAALLEIVDEIKEKEKPEIIEICYHSDNIVARSLYLSVGFKESGVADGSGDVLAVIHVHAK